MNLVKADKQRMRALVWLARVQGLFYALTGAWALVHIESFMDVPGPKTDVWLVKTVGIQVALAVAWLVVFWRARDDPRVWGRSLGEQVFKKQLT